MKPDLMFGYEPETVGGGLPVLVATPAKTICDFLYLNPRYDSREDLEGFRLDESAMEDLFADGSLERTVARFRSAALSRRVALLKEMFTP